MAYAFFGLPMMLMVLKSVGDLLYKFLFKCMVTKRRMMRFARKRMPVMFSSTRLTASSTLSTLSKSMDGKSSVVASEYDPEAAGNEPVEPRDSNPIRIPVTLILSFTFGWIFLCAGIFMLWEDWSYFESVYFFFISLTTIGLGDVVTSRRSYMIMNFGLVSIGLSLVSVCVAVVQNEIERLYYNLLQKLLQEYNVKLATGLGKSQAGSDMKSMWQSNKAAKFLLPLLGKEKKVSILQHFTNTAEAHGVKVPDILKEIDLKHGLPAVLTVKPQDERLQSQPAEKEMDKLCDYGLLRNTLNLQEISYHEQGIQTTDDRPWSKSVASTSVQSESGKFEDKSVGVEEDAALVASEECAVQTDEGRASVAAGSQTDDRVVEDASINTDMVVHESGSTETETNPSANNYTQTINTESNEQEVMTDLSVPLANAVLKVQEEMHSVATETETILLPTTEPEPDR
ncbi:unnamed protein product [Soboliphyme baturini]|uniref:Ion_trans_2 domain-containing protein n=1 Tax=Soboliphyme baturini TaxID=241478 RepID=A0A183IU78_9BILA|nr:unnamed protein product [Soboliphyme baturini]